MLLTGILAGLQVLIVLVLIFVIFVIVCFSGMLVCCRFTSAHLYEAVPELCCWLQAATA